MAYKAANNARSTLAVGLGGTVGDTTLQIDVDDVSLFPVINDGGVGDDFTLLTLTDAALNKEIVKVTRHDTGSASFTIVRAQESTSVRVWQIGDSVSLRLTAGVVNQTYGHPTQNTGAHAASAISVAPTGGISSTNVQAAIAELDSEKAASGHTHSSVAISHTPSGLIASTNVGAALTALGGDSGSSTVGFKAGGAGSASRSVFAKLSDIVSICDKGAGTAASAATNDAAIAAVSAVSGTPYVPDGVFVATTASVPYLKDLDGPGFVQIASVNFPAGNVEASLTIPVPGVFPTIPAVYEYLSTRSIRNGALVTISVASGMHNYSGNGIDPYHNDGDRISIIGAGSGATTLKFTGLGAASGKGGIRLIGNYALGLIDGLTLDGDNWNGHSSGGPTLGAGDPNDPCAIIAKNGAIITCGSDLKIYRFARNGAIAYQGATIKADYCICTECGSDAFVASTGSNVRAISAQAIDGWGVGFYADYGGTIWATPSTASGMKKRGGTSGGDGYAANYGGTIYADGSSSIKNADTGYTSVCGTLIINSATAGGTSPDANAGYGLRAQGGARVIGEGFVSKYNTGGGALITGGAVFQGDGMTTSNNGAIGTYVTDGGVFVSNGFVSKSNPTRGILVERGAHATITGLDIQNNGSNGIECQDATIRGTGAVALKNNAGWGCITRAAGVVDMQGVSEASVVTGNGSGSFSPAKDTSTGVSQSFNYAAA